MIRHRVVASYSSMINNLATGGTGEHRGYRGIQGDSEEYRGILRNTGDSGEYRSHKRGGGKQALTINESIREYLPAESPK